MSVVPFRRARRQTSRPVACPPCDIATRLRTIIDRYQVLALSKPLVAVWLIEWLELFINRQLD